MTFQDLEAQNIHGNKGKESGKMPKQGGNSPKSTKKGGQKQEKEKPMVLMPDTQNATPEKGRPITSTERAAQKPNTSTVADGEAG